MNIISKYSNGFHLEETTRFIKKTVLCLSEVLLKCVFFDKRSQLYMHISAMHLKTARRCVEVKLCPYSYLHHALKNFSSSC